LPELLAELRRGQLAHGRKGHGTEREEMIGKGGERRRNGNKGRESIEKGKVGAWR